MEDQAGRTRALQQTGHAITTFPMIRLILRESASER